jgi:hypothetical protein
MNDSELEQRLKAAREPVFAPDYLESFPQTVLANLRSARRCRALTRGPWLPRLAWGLAAAACLLIAFTVGQWRGRVENGGSGDVLADLKVVQETLGMFPNRVRAIVRDANGINLVLSDSPDVPASTPIYVRICDGRHCSSLVTFSGQEIQVAGQKMTVLSESDGGIILEGNKFVWSSTGKIYARNGLKIEARPLSSAIM